MLLGEYAVLYAKPALVLAVDQRITVTVTPSDSSSIAISSPGYAEWVGDLSTLGITAPFTFVTACLWQLRHRLPGGCHVLINSDFTDQIGLGSSAAVTVATLAALYTWCKITFSSLSLIKAARSIVRLVQGGLGSGADVAAAVMGGIVYYQAKPLLVIPATFENMLPLTVIYSGSKTATSKAITQVSEDFACSPMLFKKLCEAIAACTKQGYAALQQKNYSLLGKVMNVQQGLLESLGVATPELVLLLQQLRSQPQIFGAKISGAGLGDCVIALGAGIEKVATQLLVKQSSIGVRY
jgi:mevalonate kinase